MSNIAQRLAKLAERFLEAKAIKVLVGKNNIPRDNPNEIIFHIDI